CRSRNSVCGAAGNWRSSCTAQSGRIREAADVVLEWALVWARVPDEATWVFLYFVRCVLPGVLRVEEWVAVAAYDVTVGSALAGSIFAFRFDVSDSLARRR